MAYAVHKELNDLEDDFLDNIDWDREAVDNMLDNLSDDGLDTSTEELVDDDLDPSTAEGLVEGTLPQNNTDCEEDFYPLVFPKLSDMSLADNPTSATPLDPPTAVDSDTEATEKAQPEMQSNVGNHEAFDAVVDKNRASPEIYSEVDQSDTDNDIEEGFYHEDNSHLARSSSNSDNKEEEEGSYHEDNSPVSRSSSNSDSKEEEECPFCGDLFPSEPSTRLLKLRATLLAMPNAMSLDWTQTAELCQLHEDERTLIPEGISKGWPIKIDFDALELRINKHLDLLKRIIEYEEPSYYLKEAEKTWSKQGRQAMSLDNQFSTFQLEQPGYYGYVGLEIIMKSLQKITNSEHFHSKKVAALPMEYLMRQVFIPELALCLIAEDMNLNRNDPKVKATLESSRDFGAAVFSIGNETDSNVDSNDINHPSTSIHERTQLKSIKHNHNQLHSHEQSVLKQLPPFIAPCIKSVFDPPRSGKCGYDAIAASLEKHLRTSYLTVRIKLKEELSLNKDAHQRLISTPARQTCQTNPNATELVDKLIVQLSLDHKEAKGNPDYCLQMPSMGYVIASAFERPLILFTPHDGTSYTFFPYRIPPNDNLPIVIALVDGNHFVSLGVGGSDLVTFPELYGCGNNWSLLQQTKIPEWIHKYQDQMDQWVKCTCRV